MYQPLFRFRNSKSTGGNQMGKAIFLFLLAFLLVGSCNWPAARAVVEAADKITFGIPAKVSPAYYLPLLAGQEQGLWKEQGLDMEWVSFEGSAQLLRAVATGRV